MAISLQRPTSSALRRRKPRPAGATARRFWVALAAIYRLLRELSAPRVVALQGGRVAADAAPAEVLRPDIIREVFGVEAELHRGRAGKPWIVYGD